jgi:hypothetical protein
MLLQWPDTGFRAVRPAIRQVATSRSGAGNPTFASPTLPGSLLAWLGVTRAGTTPGHPDDDAGWFQQGADIGFPRDDNTNENTLQAWLLDGVVTPRTVYNRTLQRSNGTLWEITGARAAGVTMVSLADQASNSTHDLGSLGVLSSDRIALMVIGSGRDLGNTWTITPGVWRSRFLCSRDSDASGVDSFFGQNFPYSWHGDAIGAGVALEASIATNLSDRWGGICIVLA